MKPFRSLASLPFLLLGACTSTRTNAALPPAEFTPIQGDDGVVIWSAGADAWFADPKDAELRRALAYVDERLAELPDELEQPEFPVEAIELALHLIGSPMSLRVALVSEPAAGKLPFHAQITVDEDASADAQRVAEQLSTVLGQYGVPSLGRAADVHDFQTGPRGPSTAYHGALGDKVVIAVNDVETDELELGSLDLPRGVEPFFAYKLDFRQLGSAMEQALLMAMASAGQAGADLDGAMASSMWMRDTVVQGGMGHGADRLYGSTRTLGFASAASQAGLMADGPLAPREIAMVPRDATWATLSRVNWSGYLALATSALRDQMEGDDAPAMADPLAMIEAFTGLDVEDDLVANLGETIGVYTSDTTGGGGLYSLVMFVAVTNEAKLSETLQWAESEINAAADTHAKGYVAVRTSALGDTSIATLTFPGVPAPLELSYALDAGYLFFALNRSALGAALEQARKGGSSIVDNPRFAELGGARLDDAYSLQFIDTPALVPTGYSLVGMVSSALANAVRSKSDRARELGPVLPPFGDVVRDAKGYLAIGRIEESDLVVRWQSDRSMLVNACGVSGLIGGAAGVAALGELGALIAAKAQAEREEIEEALEGEMDMDTDEPESMEELEEALEDAFDESMEDEGDMNPPQEPPPGDPK